MFSNIHKYLTQAGDYLQYKIVAGLIAVVFSDDFFKLLLLFIALELLDIFTRWLVLSRQCHLSIFPQSPCGLWCATKFLRQAHRWRFIRSDGLRDGFCDKMLVYLLLLLTGAFVDAAFQIGHTPRVLTTIIVVVLGSTEALSILENLSECGVSTINTIKSMFKSKIPKVGE